MVGETSFRSPTFGRTVVVPCGPARDPFDSPDDLVAAAEDLAFQYQHALPLHRWDEGHAVAERLLRTGTIGGYLANRVYRDPVREDGGPA